MKTSRFFQFLIPKDKLFFPLFRELAETINRSSETLYQLFACYPENSTELIEKIKDYERKGDSINHQIVTHLSETFITPFDHEDIQKLAHELDDILDYINSTGQKISLYQPNSGLSKYVVFSELIRDSAGEIRIMLNNLSFPNRTGLLEKNYIEIHDLENRMDELFDETISLLFQKEKDTIELIKHKEIIQTLEKVSDSMEHVANIVQSIMIKSR